MNEFEEWFQNLPSVVRHSTDKKRCKKAWNAAVEKFEEALDIHDTKGDLRHTVKKLHTER